MSLPLPDEAFLLECIKKRYQAQALSLRRLASNTGKYIYQVHLEDGTSWLLRVVADAGKAALVEFVRLLQFFELHNYPAERVVVAIDQMVTIGSGDWHLLMTTFLAGSPPAYTPADFTLLGAMVGRLHALKSLLSYRLHQAGMLPSGELAFAQGQLSAITSCVPRQYRAQYDVLEKALLSFDRGTYLPTTLIHNDCHPANALMTAPDQVTLLDWEGAGIGPAVIDLGFLLLNCDGRVPWEPTGDQDYHVEEELLRAVIEGYYRHYRLTADELDYLPTALRFRSLVFGACDFAAAIAQQQNADFVRWWWRRYCAAEEIADRARNYIECIS